VKYPVMYNSAIRKHAFGIHSLRRGSTTASKPHYAGLKRVLHAIALVGVILYW
jgi:hypothetical protein